MDITLKEMKLTFIVNQEEKTLHRIISDLDNNIIWEAIDKEADYELTDAGMDDYEQQMKALLFWNIVTVERIIL